MANKETEIMMKLLIKLQTLKATKGQGVIEYAGALVIAAVLVAATLAIGPTGISNLFTDIMNSVQSYFTGQLPT
jgi:Flp pilus assembly pilin Flp